MMKKIIEVEKDLEEIVPGFIERKKEDVFLMRDLLKKNDYEMIETMGHRLKGNAGGYGFDDLGLCGKELEEKAREHNNDEVSKVIDDIERYLSEIEVVFI